MSASPEFGLKLVIPLLTTANNHKVVVLDEVQARWLSDLSRAANNYKIALANLASGSLAEIALVNAGLSPATSLAAIAADVQQYFGAVKVLQMQKWSIFLIADLDEEVKGRAMTEIDRFVGIALGPLNTRSIPATDGFTWFKRGFTLDNF